ncbi:MAG: CpXC domain-containing protein [Elusimicrobiales bacterium]|jgi:uncharacterized Zn-finger protein|nr:CpXC domain-containing protein [Elusimicrobiales bacterium]HOJ86115.1 CpXC domain-containing protein [Elusimicrobiales bacterium]HOL63100.1 CpXC domain-containing protein [Elusimicrobiales bacterium]HPO96115.1 CpXC domain-containing protein [Elusimicrobiales bacterium]
MATENYRIVRCPHCSNEFEAKFWSVVRGDIDIDLKELILNGEFNLLMCPHCEKIFKYEENFIYLDPSAEILAFVMPDYYEMREDLVEKLKEDYLSIKGHLSAEKKLNFEPYYLFGVEQLVKLLKNDTDIQEETDVIEFICFEKKLKTKKINKIKAREKDLPFILPYSESLKKGDLLELLNEIYSGNKRLKRIKNLMEEIESIEDEIDFLDED